MGDGSVMAEETRPPEAGDGSSNEMPLAALAGFAASGPKQPIVDEPEPSPEPQSDSAEPAAEQPVAPTACSPTARKESARYHPYARPASVNQLKEKQEMPVPAQLVCPQPVPLQPQASPQNVQPTLNYSTPNMQPVSFPTNAIFQTNAMVGGPQMIGTVPQVNQIPAQGRAMGQAIFHHQMGPQMMQMMQPPPTAVMQNGMQMIQMCAQQQPWIALPLDKYNELLQASTQNSLQQQQQQHVVPKSNIAPNIQQQPAVNMVMQPP